VRAAASEDTYGCHAHKHSGVCGNKLMIRQDRLEEQLLDTIEQRILNPERLNQLIARCEGELRKRRQGKLIEAIETAGDINMLTERLRELDREVKRIEEAITSFRPVKLDVAVGQIREHIKRAIKGFRESLETPGVPLKVTTPA